MSLLGVSMDIFLAALMITALVLGARLNVRLKALKQSHDGFARAIVELNDAAVRAERGLAALREATSETHDSLLSRIETARSLSAKLDSQIQTSRGLIERQVLSPPQERGQPMTSADLAPGDPPAAVRRLAERFGLIAGGGSHQTSVRDHNVAEVRPRPPSPPKPSRRPLPEEDELFAPPKSSTPPPPTAPAHPHTTSVDWAADLEANLAAPPKGPTPEDFAAKIRARKAVY